jgi:hypothetical protein
MSLASSDLIFYGSANMPENGSSTVGGAIDTTTRVDPSSTSLFNSMSGGKVDIASSNAGDTTQTVTITGRSSAGSIISETLSLNGTTTVNGTNTYDRLMKVVVSGAHTGTITLTKHGGSTICSLLTGELTMRRPFYSDAADAGGGSSRTFYEKIFLKNTNGTFAALSLQVTLSANPSGFIQFGLAASVGDSLTTTNNTTAPAGISFGTGAVNCPGTDLQPGIAIGIWISETLAAGTAAGVNTFTLTGTEQTI